MTKRVAPATEPAPQTTNGPEPSGAVGVVDQERLDRLDALADKATAQYGGQPEPEEPKVTRELVNQPKDPKTGKFLSKDPEAEPVAAVEPVAEEPATEPAAEVAAEPVAPVIQKHKLKVNGRELELTTEELITRAQKIEAADDYIKQAAQLFKATKEPAATPKAEPSVEEDDAALARAIQTGTEQEAVEAIRKMRARPSQSMTADDVLRTVQSQLAITEANRKFEAEYPDIVKDPQLFALVTVEFQKLVHQQDPRGYQEKLMASAESVKNWKASLVPQSAQLQEKVARKATVTVIPTAAARAAGKTEEKPESHSDVIAELAKQRNAR
jgi:hypothetical protein